MFDNTRALAESKLIILYLIEKIEIPLSNSEICQFALEKNLMDYFSVQQYLSEMVESGLRRRRRNSQLFYKAYIKLRQDRYKQLRHGKLKAHKSRICRYGQLFSGNE